MKGDNGMQTKGLTIGQRIRMTRKYLGVKQYEITSGKITRNLISAIENDKVRLTSENARLIYDNLNRFAKERNLEIDLDLSEVLGDEPDFQAEIKADSYINQLRRHIKADDAPSDDVIHEIEDFLYAWDIPIKKAEVYTLFGDIYGLKNEKLRQLFYYTKAFELYSVEKYVNSLPRLASKISECSEKLNSPEIGVRFCELAISKDPTTYREEMYNLYMLSAISNSKLGNHQKAIKNIDVCIDRFTDDLGPEYYQAVSIKADCYERQNEIMDAIQYYTHATNGFYRLNCLREGIESTIPMITLLHNNDLENSQSKIDALLNEMHGKLGQLHSAPIDLEMKLAYMYTQLDKKNEALNTYESVMSKRHVMSDIDVVELLEQSYELFNSTNRLARWLSFYKLSNIDLVSLDDPNQRKLATILTYSLKYLIESREFDFAKRITHDLATLAISN